MDLWDDWWAHRQNEPLSVVREEWSKIRSSMKIARWNLPALWQWSACSAVNVSLSHSALLLSVSLSAFILSMFFFRPPTFPYISTFTLLFVFAQRPLSCCCVLMLFPCPLFSSQSHSDMSQLRLWCLSRFPLSSDVVYSEWAHTCISWQGWVCNYPVPWHWLEREAMYGRVAGCHKKKKMMDQRWEKTEEKAGW